jgi:hypothetical protein
MSLWSMMDSTVQAIQPAVSKGSVGGTQQDFTLGDLGVTQRFAGVPCSYQEASSSVQMIYAQRDNFVDSTLLFAQDPGDLVNCEVTIQRSRIGDTLTLIPKGTRDPIQMGQTWVWPLDCLRIRQP